MHDYEIINSIAQEVKTKMLGEGSGHDWWHVYRVWQLAKKIAQEEKADMFVVELAALLHDIADWKFQEKQDHTVGSRVAAEMLNTHGVEPETISKITHIIDNISFKGANVLEKMECLEGKVVQDADRLDAIGAIGIGRTFAYGGHKGVEMHNPEIAASAANSFEDYKKSGKTTINHFYEKLLLLMNRMNTQTGKGIAQGRHVFMEKFLDEFYSEWEGEK